MVLLSDIYIDNINLHGGAFITNKCGDIKAPICKIEKIKALYQTMRQSNID